MVPAPLPSDLELQALKRHLLALGSIAATRRAAQLAVQAVPAELRVSQYDATAVLEIGAAVAREGSPVDLATFLRTGRLPEVVALTPRQRVHISDGTLNLTAVRGIAPATVLGGWLHSAPQD